MVHNENHSSAFFIIVIEGDYSIFATFKSTFSILCEYIFTIAKNE